MFCPEQPCEVAHRPSWARGANEWPQCINAIYDNGATGTLTQIDFASFTGLGNAFQIFAARVNKKLDLELCEKISVVNFRKPLTLLLCDKGDFTRLILSNP